MIKKNSKLVLVLILVGVVFSTAAGNPNINYGTTEITDAKASSEPAPLGTWSNGAPADGVLGQPDFTSKETETTSSRVYSPWDIATDSSNGKVFVSDMGNHRILRFSSMEALTNGGTAEAVLGQNDFTSNLANHNGERIPAANTLDSPMGICVDPSGRLWVADSDNQRVLGYSNATTLLNGADADYVLGKEVFNGDYVYERGADGMAQPTDVACDASGRLWVADSLNSRVLRFDDVALKENGADADGVLGQANFTDLDNDGPKINTMDVPWGLTITPNGHLYVADRWNNRILRYNNAASKENGANADGVLGQPDFTSDTEPTETTATSIGNPYGLTVDDAGTLYVSDASASRILVFEDAINKGNGAAADHVLGQEDFTHNSANHGEWDPAANTLNYPRFLHYNPTTDILWAADTGNHRILHWNDVSLEASAPTPVGPGTYENDDVHIISTGIWTTWDNANASGGSTSYANDPAASASLSFYGGQVSLLYTGYSNRGEIEISIDGGAPEILDQYTSEYTYQNRWDSQLLDTSLHTITLSHPGDTTTIDLDALIVAPHNPTGSLIKSIDQLTIDGDLYYDIGPYVDDDYVVYAMWDGVNVDLSEILLYQISTGITTQIGTEGFLLKISGNHIIWSGCNGICLYQIDTATTTSIEDASMEYPQEPFLDGDNIVWSSNLDGDAEIYRYQISTGIKTQITKNTTEDNYPHINGDAIVWSGMTNGHYEIFLHLISKGTTTQISKTEFELNWWPQPSGDYVVWFGDDFDGDSEIMLYQISTGTTTQITDNTADDQYPEIDGNYIVWSRDDGTFCPRYLYEISTGTTRQIGPNSTYDLHTRNIINGDFVVWTDFASANTNDIEFYLYQISTNTLNLVFEDSLSGPYPQLSENHLVWGRNDDIFLATLVIPANTPPAAVNLNAATGTYPGEVDLSWTAPGEDGNVGTAAEYIVRYANAAIDTQAKWDAASDVTGEPVPQIAGTEESLTVSSLSPGQTYYFALRTLDESGNLSDLSNSPSVEIQVPPPVGPGTYENDDVHIISTGTWNTGENANASGGSTRYSNDPDASATLLFYGGQVSLIFTGDTDRGDVEILIDDKLMPGVDPDVVNQYSSSTTFQNRWDSPLLDNGLHNITVRHPGGADNIDLDAFIVAEHNPTASIVESIDQLTINDTIGTYNNEWYPSIDGDYIVWQGDYDISGIFLHQISTGETTKIANGGWHPQIHGNNVVWECGDVCLYQIGSGLITVIEDDDDYGDGGQYPQLYGDYVIFTSNQDGDNEIYRYQISTGIKTHLTNNTSGDYWPDIEGDYVVWGGFEGEDYDIYLHQLSTDTTINLTNDQTGNFGGAHISGDYLVWISIDSSDVYLYQISTATTTQITNDSTGDWAPETDGNHIVWLKYTSDNYIKDIYLYTIDTGISKKITSTGTNFIWDLDTGPYVKDDFVFWMSRDSSAENDNEVYLYQISTDTIHNVSNNLDGGDGHPELDGNHLVWSGDFEIYLATLDTSDTIPPAAVTLNAATGSNTGEVDLEWIAPGDNGNTGTAAEYILRYANTAIDSESAWDSASDVTGEPVPQTAGSAETLTVSGLTLGETYYFALRTMDSDANLSELSNSPSAVAKAPSHPGVGTYENEDANIVYTGTWTTWTDVRASGGSIRYSNDPAATATLTFYGRQVSLLFTRYTSRGNIEITIDDGTPVLLNQYGSSLTFQNRWDSPLMDAGTHTVVLRHPGGTKYIDLDALIVSSPETIPPAAVTLNAVTGTSNGQVNLSWTAPGDDGTTGTAASYIVRYAASAIDTQAKWDAAADVTGEPTPLPAGSAQSMTVSGLTPGQTYFFALRTLDDSNNLSDLSTSPSAVAKSPTPVDPGTYQNDNENIVYTGNWTTWTDARASGGSTRYSNDTTASATLTFTGRQVSLLFTRYTSRGNIAITIDGGTPVLLNQYGSTLTFQNRWDSPLMDAGTHTVKFSHPGGTKYIDLDAIIISDPETIPPAAVTLSADTGASNGQVYLEWAAPGDDGTTGTAASYIVRYAASAIDSQAKWDAAADVTGEPTPESAWSPQSMTISGLTPGQTYFFALRTLDDSNNLSDLSNSPSAAAKAPTPVSPGTYQNKDSNIIYTGNWTVWNTTSASGGSTRYSNDTTASATLTFTDRQVSLLFTRYTSRGDIAITIDGGTPVLLNQYGSTLTFQNRWDSPLMDAGTHTVVFSHPGGTKYIDLDAIIISDPETIPPAAVTLAADTGASNGQVNLAWNAPGDDDMTGTATSYIVRYAAAAIDSQAKWDAAADVTGEPTPLVAGSTQSMTVSGLVPGQTYFFALRTLDDSGNLSALSNSPSAVAKSPTPVGEGTYENEDANIVYTGNWTVWDTTGASGSSTRYSNDTSASASLTFTGRQVSLLFTRFTSRGNIEITIDGGTPVLLNQYGSTLTFQNRWDSPLMDIGTHTVVLRHPGGTKYIDLDALIVSTPETTPPSAVTLSAATGSSTGQVTLDWTAPGDDGDTGTAAEYIIRYADSIIDSQTAWDAAADVTGEPAPQAAGTPESLIISGLVPGQTYFFALRTLDDSGNLSYLSNSPSAVAYAPPPVGAGTYQEDDANIAYTGTWTSWSHASASGGAIRYINQPDASATLTFTGRQVSLIFTRYTSRGEIEITIDGGAPVLLNQYGAMLSFQNRWDSPTLDAGTHTIRLRHPGGTKYIDIDAIEVRAEPQ